ncbi:MAG: sulfatase/phosphatase domain-containing protein, partial [Planctomycetota bacterium]
AKLDELKLAESTLLVFTSDNGGLVHRTPWGVVTNNAPFRSGKGSLYEGGIRVPLLIRCPGMTKAGSTSDVPVSTQDLFPTILSAIGCAEKEIGKVDGANLLPLLRDPKAQLERDALFWHYPHYYPTTTPVTAMRSGHYKLLHFYEGDRVELYDLKTDPGERTSLTKTKPEVVKKLRARLKTWIGYVNARLPTPRPGKSGKSR